MSLVGPVISAALKIYAGEFMDYCSEFDANCYAFNTLELITLTTFDNPKTVGMCDTTHPLKGRVYIKTGMSEKKTRTVFTHEMGHCVLNYGHSIYDNEIMSAYLYVPTDLEDWRRMIENFFYDRHFKSESESYGIYILNEG